MAPGKSLLTFLFPVSLMARSHVTPATCCGSVQRLENCLLPKLLLEANETSDDASSYFPALYR